MASIQKDKNLLVLNSKGQLVPKHPKNKKRVQRSKAILRPGQKYEKKRGQLYANKLLTSTLKELEQQGEERRELIKEEKAKEKKKER